MVDRHPSQKSPDYPVAKPHTEERVRKQKRRFAASEETQQSVLHRYEDEGFTGQFGVRGPGQVICFSCREVAPAERIQVKAMRRLEGSSDPGDEMAVAAVVCPNCGIKGTLSLSYGVAASAEDALVLKGLDDRRHEGTLRAGV